MNDQTQTKAEASPPLGAPELRARERVELAYGQVVDGTSKLPEKSKECRFGNVDGVIVIRSLVTPDMHYAVDIATSAFFRSHSPDSPGKFTSCAPREVIQQERAWLIPLLQQTTWGGQCLHRYAPGARPVTPASGPTPTVQAPTGPAPELLGALAGVKPVSKEKRTVIVQKEASVVLQPTHLSALLNASKIPALSVPASAEVQLTVNDQGFLVISWKEESWTE